MLRYKPNGALDRSFGQGGAVSTDFGGLLDRANEVVIQPDGKIVTAGAAQEPANTGFAISRHNPDGSLDLSFGENGTVITQFSQGYDQANAMFILPRGLIVAAGYTSKGGAQFAVARYLG